MKEMSYMGMCLLQTIAALSRNKKKRYCFPSQEALLKLLSKFYGVTRCRRALNYHLLYLEQNGYIHRIRRISKGDDGFPRFASTIYRLGKRGLGLLGNILGRLSQAGVAAWGRVKKIAHEDNWPRVQSLLSGIGRAVPPG